MAPPLSLKVSVFSTCAQLCLTLYDPTDYSPPGSPVYGVSQAEGTGVGCHFLLQGIFPTQELNSSLVH